MLCHLIISCDDLVPGMYGEMMKMMEIYHVIISCVDLGSLDAWRVDEGVGDLLSHHVLRKFGFLGCMARR